MLDLPSVDIKFGEFIEQVKNLRRGSKGAKKRPHKLVMLLAVADLFDQGAIEDNRIFFDTQLKTAFTKCFERYRTGNDLNQPSQPFFHLRSAPFWNHQLKEGKEASYELLTTSGGGEKRIKEHLEYAYLSRNAFEIMVAPDLRARLVEQLSAMLERH